MSTCAKQSISIILIALLVLIVACPSPAVAQCSPPGPNTKCWTGAIDNTWGQDGNWDPFGIPGATDDVYHLIGGVIEMNLGTPGDPVVIASFTVDGANGGGIEIQAEKGLKVAGNFVNQNLVQEYALTVKESGFLRVDLDLLRVAGVLEASGAAGPTAVSIGDDIETNTAWTLEADTELEADSIGFFNTWTVGEGALVQVNSIGPTAVGESSAVCLADWFINNGRVEVLFFAEGLVCYFINVGQPDISGPEELVCSKLMIGLRVAIESGGEVVGGTNPDNPNHYFLLAKGGEVIVDTGTFTCTDVFGRSDSTITLRNGGAFSTEHMRNDAAPPHAPGIGSLFYGDGANTFTSNADETIFRDPESPIDPDASSIIAVDHEGATNPNLTMDCKGSLTIRALTDEIFTYTVNVDQPDEKQVRAS